MEKQTLEVTDARLDARFAAQCALHVVLGVESLSILASTATTLEVLALQTWLYKQPEQTFESVEWNLRRILRDELLVSMPFSQVRCAIFHPNTTLVPRRLFQHNALPDYFKLLLPASNYVYGYDEIPELDVFLVYATDPALMRLSSEFFPKGRNRHLALPLLKYWWQQAAGNSYSVFVNFRHQMAQVAVFERQNLLFYNVFPFSASSDLLYFILLVYDQFRINPVETPLTVAGNLLPDSELYRILQRFIREIRFGIPPADYSLPRESQVLPAHCYIDLFCLKNL